jgi:hypothetical protein
MTHFMNSLIAVKTDTPRLAKKARVSASICECSAREQVRSLSVHSAPGTQTSFAPVFFICRHDCEHARVSASI